MKGLLQRTEIFLGILVFLIGILATGILINWQEIIFLEKEKEQLSIPVSLPSGELGYNEFPTMEDLPFIVEECVKILAREKVLTRSYNLQYIGEEQGVPLYPKYAVMGFKLQGSWEGIEKALSEMEDISHQNIHVREMRLNEEGGEILLWIHFLEPDNFSFS